MTANTVLGAMLEERPEALLADGMRILWDVAIPMGDGVVLQVEVVLGGVVDRGGDRDHALQEFLRDRADEPVYAVFERLSASSA